MNDSYEEAPSEKDIDNVFLKAATESTSVVADITTGHALAIAVMDVLARNKTLVLSVAYTLRRDGAVEFSFETHPHE